MSLEATDLSSLSITIDEPGDDDGVLRCTEDGCSRPLEYSGRGRKPVKCAEHKRAASTGTRRPRANGDVERAVEALDSLYELASVGLMMMGALEAASDLKTERSALRAKNASYLANDPDMVRSINKVGKTGGRFGFFMSQAMVLGPVAMIAAGEMSERRRQRAKERAEEEAPDAAMDASWVPGLGVQDGV